MTAMQPLANVRELAKLTRTSAIPPYPDPTALGCPVIRGAPLAPEVDDELVPFGWETYATSLKEFYGLQRAPMLESPDPAKTAKRTAAINLVMRDLRALEIPPAEWVRKRIADFHCTSLAEVQDRPPVGFVFAHGAVGNCINGDPSLSWLGELSQPRTFMHRVAKATLKMWHERRRRSVALVNAGKASEVAGVWDLWDNVLSLCRNDGKTAQATLDRERARGVYLWGQNVLV